MGALSVLAAIVGAFSLNRPEVGEGDLFFDSNGTKIRYVAAGSGEPVVLIHGWMSDATMWGRDINGNPKLTPVEGFQVIALDCRGHGKSGQPHDSERYGVEMALDVTRLLDHLKIKKAHLVGYSMGSFIAGKIAAMSPERVSSIVFGGQAPLLEGAPAGGSNEVEVFARAVEEGKGLGAYILEVLPADKPKPSLEAANGLAKIMFGNKDVVALAAAGKSLGELRVRAEDLKKCSAPMLFVHGALESEGVKGSVDFALKALGRGERKVIEGGDHVTTLIKPAFGQAIVEFLKNHRTAN